MHFSSDNAMTSHSDDFLNHLYSTGVQPYPEEVCLSSRQEKQAIGSRCSKPHMERCLTGQFKGFQKHKAISIE